jgi:hypothetical protein
MITVNLTHKELDFYSAVAEITRAVIDPRPGCAYGHATDGLAALNLFKHHYVELEKRSQGLSERQKEKAIEWVSFFYEPQHLPRIKRLVSIINKDWSPR